MVNKRNPNDSTTFIAFLNRRTFLSGSTALLVSSMMPSVLTSCSGGAPTVTTTPTPTPTPAPASTSLSIKSVSSTTPTALTPITLQMAGFDPTRPFTVSLSDPAGHQIKQTPIRAAADGTLVVPAPLHVDATTGNTSAFATVLSVSQNGQTASVSITIGDIPQLSDLGVTLGEISRAFYIHQELALGASINAQQAIAALSPTVGNATLLANLQAQLNNIILARNDIDRIIANNTVQISIGTAPDGTAIFFNSKSVAMMDRTLAQYLLACTANGTIVPSVAPSRRSKHATIIRPQVSPSVMASIVQGIQTLSGAVSFKSTQQTLSSSESSSLDKILSVASTTASLVGLGATVIAIGAAVIADAPVIAAFATATATYAAITGVVIGSASIGNDIYNLGTNVYGAVTDAPGSAAQTTAINNMKGAGLTLANDTITTFLNAEGLGGVNVSSIETAATNVFEGIFEPAAKDALLAADGLLASVNSLLIQKAFSGDTNAASESANSLGPNTIFGQVDGTANITNNQGILAGLTAVGAGNSGSGLDLFTCMAAPNGSYNLVIPIGDSSLTYGSMTVSAFDPVSDLTLGSSTVDLRGLNPNTPIKGPSFSGSCNDTDAGNPDSDDPDCD